MNQRAKLSLIGLCFYGFIATATFQCPAAVAVSIAQITAVTTRISQVLNAVKITSFVVTKLVNESYADLGKKLKENGINSKTISEMEGSLSKMKAQADTLDMLLDVTESNASQLFSLLEDRADQNETKALRKSMLADIEAKEEQFDEKMEAARDVLSQINKSIQKYDDILGYIQVGTGLDKIDEYIGDVNGILEEGNNLNSRIQSAVDEGLLIITSIQTQGDSSKLKN